MITSLRLLLLAVFALLFAGTASAHYNPQLGRWLSRDPMGEAGGFNLYAYCGNDPVNGHDPLGLADLCIGYDSDGDAVLELSARIVNGIPQVHYWDWAHWWGPVIGGGVNHFWQAPSASELARLFQRTPNGWRLASYSEVWAARNQQFAESFPVAMRNAAETTTAVAKLHYGGLALMTCPLILMEGGLTWGTVAAAGHEGYAGVSLLSGAVAGENYATSPEGWMLKQTGAPEWAVIGTDMAAGVGSPFMVGRGPQLRLGSGYGIGEMLPNGQLAGIGPGAMYTGETPLPPVLYRGVAAGSAHDIQQFTGGGITPRGGSASAYLHVNENMTNSVFTSWTPDISVARQQFAGGNGVVFAVEPNKIQNIIIDTASFSRKPAEREFLIQGPLFRVKRL